MNAITEERALLVECYTAMREIAVMFASVQKVSTSEPRDVDTMSEADMLTEMRDALHAVEQQIGPALKTPMVKQMLKMMSR